MPIFEYRCRGCGSEFEAIVQSSTVPECPRCDGHDLDKMLSVFAVGGPNQGSGPAYQPGPTLGGCGTCGDPRGPGACKLD